MVSLPPPFPPTSFLFASVHAALLLRVPATVICLFSLTASVCFSRGPNEFANVRHACLVTSIYPAKYS